MPGLSGGPKQLTQAPVALLRVQVAQEPLLDEQPYEAVEVGMFFKERPIEPARFVVLAVGIIVAGLRAANLIAHSNHWCAEREHGKRQEIPDLPVSQILYARIVRRPLDTAVPASIVIGA